MSSFCNPEFYSKPGADCPTRMTERPRAAWRRKKREHLAELKSAAIAELERRDCEVRGKTPDQIRQILKRRPLKQKSVPTK
jgi:hypothetical protein